MPGATNTSQAEQLQYRRRAVFGLPVSESTLRRLRRRSTPPWRARIERARAAIRRVVWTLLALRPGGLPWISVCGREPANWYVLDLDATIVNRTSRKERRGGHLQGQLRSHAAGCVGGRNP
ncbi:hypothetical protein P9869_43495 [Streptomyces ossamyceticus]|nr:hypothetical protein [Streptomyces ossamyceticus]